MVVLAWLLHGLLLGWSLLGEAPRFGFAPALSVTVWLVAAVYADREPALPAVADALGPVHPGRRRRASWPWSTPANPLHANASAWLPLHLGAGHRVLWPLCRRGGACLVHDARTEERIRLAADPHSGLPLLTMERLTFRFVGAGFVLLSATLLVGLLFEEQLYGATPGNGTTRPCFPCCPG